MCQITEATINHPKSIGSDCYSIEYECKDCGKIVKEFHTGFDHDYHEMAELCISDHTKLHAESELGRKFYDIFTAIKRI